MAAALLLEQCVLGSSLPAALELAKAGMEPAAVEAVEVAEAAADAGRTTEEMLGLLGPKLMPGHPKADLAGRSCGFPQVRVISHLHNFRSPRLLFVVCVHVTRTCPLSRLLQGQYMQSWSLGEIL